MKIENNTGPDTSKKKLKLKYPVEKNEGFVFTSYFIEKIPIFVSCKSSLYRKRTTLMPPQLATRLTIDLQGEWRDNYWQQLFTIREQRQKKILVFFGTADNIYVNSVTQTPFLQMEHSTPALYYSSNCILYTHLLK
jgi:hypothetical protein